MGLFGNLRAANKIGTATALVTKLLDVERELGTFRGDTKDTANKLVLAVWAEVPALREAREIPRAATLAAAAMANGVRYFDGPGQNKVLADVLFSSLRTFLGNIYPTLVLDPDSLSRVDNELMTRAYSVFDQ